MLLLAASIPVNSLTSLFRSDVDRTVSSHASAPSQLSAQLDTLALHAIQEEYEQINYDLFGDALNLPQLAFFGSAGSRSARLGYFQAAPSCIFVSYHLLLDYSWLTLVEVLKHEMAHQFVLEVLQVEESPHGPVFRRVCRERAIDGRAAGLSPLRGSAAPAIVERVRALLALAQSANENEAKNAAAGAQRLMLKYNIQRLTDTVEREFVVEHVGRPTGRVQEFQRTTAGILQQFFFVKTVWVRVWRPREGKRGSVLELCGGEENVSLASYVHDFLHQSVEALWATHRRAHGISSNRDRLRFLAGAVSGFATKLAREQQTHEKLGLVWLGDPELGAYFQRRYPRTTRVSYQSSAGSDAHIAGRAAGAKIVLHRGVAAGPNNRRKALPSGR